MNDYRQELERRKGRRDQVQANLEKAEKSSNDLYMQTIYCEEAQAIIQEVAQITQKELEYHVSELVTLAMASVFNGPYQLIVEFVQRRNRTETDFWFERDSKRVDPMKASGGGAVDVAAFALRVALWSLNMKKTRPVLILDEPLKWLKGSDLPEKGAEMISEICRRVGLQVIMVSHIPEQVAGADQRIRLQLKDGISEIHID